MKNIKIAGIAALAAVLLVGCGEQPVNETSSSSVESSTSSVETSSSSVESSSSSSVESSVDMGDGSTDDIAVIVTDNQDILKSNQSSQGDPNTSTDVSTSEPTSTPSSSSGSGETSKPTPPSSSTTSKPSSTSSSSSNSKPSSSSSSTTSKPSSNSSSSSSKPTSTSTWNPNAPGNKPGPYKDSYYDAGGALHCKYENMPTDSYGYPVVSYYTEDGTHVLTKAEKEKWDEEEERISSAKTYEEMLEILIGMGS